MSFRRDPTRTESNCFAANAAQVADRKTASVASQMWIALARSYQDDPDEAARCGAKAAAFYARAVELEVEEFLRS